MPGGIHIPLSVIAKWPHPNYENPSETRGWEVPILMGVLYGIGLIAVAARLFARFVLLRSGGLDDWILAINMIPLLGLSITLSLASKVYHFDRHVWDVPLSGYNSTRKIVLPIEILYSNSVGLTKLSVLLFYRRLALGTVSEGYRRIAQVSVGFVALFTVFYTFFPLIHCRPLDAFWLQVNPFWYANNHDWSCVNEEANLVTNAVISILTDFLTCGMPIVLFWKLQLPRKQKVMLGGIFVIGFCLCIIGILRLLAIRRIYNDTYDITWYTHDIWIWTGVEANVGVVCASLPCCRIYFTRYLQPTFRSWSGSGGSRGAKPSFVRSVSEGIGGRRRGSRYFDKDGLAVRSAPRDIEETSHEGILREDTTVWTVEQLRDDVLEGGSSDRITDDIELSPVGPKLDTHHSRVSQIG